jgi:hypothetical protein
MSKSRPILFDVVGAIILFVITAASISFVSPENTGKVTLVLLSLNAALIAGRLRLHIDNKVGELNDKITEHLRLFAPGKVVGNLVELALIRNPTEVNELVQEFYKACETLRHIVEFVYQLRYSHQLYEHDIKEIEKLRRGDFYRATHSFALMSEVWDNSTSSGGFDESAIFSAYMRAQYEARNRGVNVSRIYIVDDVDKVLQNERIRKHFKEMSEHHVTAKIIARSRLTKDYKEDFIIIGSRLLGLGQSSEQGSVISAEYYFNNPGSKDTFDRYLSYFKALEGDARDYKDLEKKVTEARD